MARKIPKCLNQAQALACCTIRLVCLIVILTLQRLIVFMRFVRELSISFDHAFFAKSCVNL